MSFTCPVCAAVSHLPTDETYGYCGRCHEFTGCAVVLTVRPLTGGGWVAFFGDKIEFTSGMKFGHGFGRVDAITDLFNKSDKKALTG